MALYRVSQKTTLIGYGSAEVTYKMKLADDKGTRSPSQYLTKQTEERFFCLYLTFAPQEADYDTAILVI